MSDSFDVSLMGGFCKKAGGKERVRLGHPKSVRTIRTNMYGPRRNKYPRTRLLLKQVAIKRLRSQGARESGGLEGPAVAHAAATTATTATTGSAERDARDSDFAYHSDVDSGGDTDREERDGENNNDFEGPHTSGKQEGRTGAGAAHVSQAIIAEAARMQRARLLRKPARQIHLVAFGENKLPRGPPHSSEAPACAPCRPSEAEYKTNNAWLRRSRGSTHNQISNVTCEAQDTEFPSLADAAVIAVRKSAHKYKLRHSPHFSPFVPSRDAEDEAAADWVDLSLEREREREEETDPPTPLLQLEWHVEEDWLLL